jgi:hypothetical protein
MNISNIINSLKINNHLTELHKLPLLTIYFILCNEPVNFQMLNHVGYAYNVKQKCHVKVQYIVSDNK